MTARSNIRVVRHAAAERLVIEAAAFGLLNWGHEVERAWKADAVVRGGHRSFNTDKTKAGTPRVGGTFRRSIHTVAYLDGQRIAGAGSDENGNEVPAYAAGPGALVIVGSNSGYGGFVELGTRNMPARPAAVPAVLRTKGQASALVQAGARRRAAR